MESSRLDGHNEDLHHQQRVVDESGPPAGELEPEPEGASAGTGEAGLEALQHHFSSLYEPHYQQMHPLIYYGDEFAHYQQLGQQLMAAKQVSAGGEQQEPHQQQQVKQEAQQLFHFAAAGSSSPNAQEQAAGLCRLELAAFEQHQQLMHCDSSSPLAAAAGSGLSFKADQVQQLDSPATTTAANSPSNRELHNEIERRRRSRIKNCCDVLRTLVPGLSDKTDKATVLEHTVRFMSHLVQCPSVRGCSCELEPTGAGNLQGVCDGGGEEPEAELN